MLIASTHGTYVGVSIPQALETRADATPAGARHSDGAAPGVGVAGGERGERRRSARPHRILGGKSCMSTSRHPRAHRADDAERFRPRPVGAGLAGLWQAGSAGYNPALIKRALKTSS